MSNRDPDGRYGGARQTLPFAVKQWVREIVHTSVPGIVRAYDSTTKRAQVQPALRAVYTDGREPAARPPIVDVPVRQLGTGGWLQHQAIVAGDVVLLLFSQRGIESFKETWGELSNPTSGILFEERDAMAIPWGSEDVVPVADTGIVMQSADGETYVSLQEDAVTVRRAGTTITVADDKVVIDVADSSLVYLGGEGAAQQLATRTHVDTTFNTHFHSSPAGLTGPPTVAPPLTAGDDITKKARAE